jgi:hypothetical protein
MRAWLAATDAEARQTGQSSAPAVWQYPTAAFGADGSIWLAEGKTSTSVNVIRVRANGKVERKKTQKLRCANLRVATWDQYLIFFSDPRVAQAQCPEVRKING